MRSAPWWAIAGAVSWGAAFLAAVPVLLIALDLDQRWSRGVALGGSALGGAVFAALWPAMGWRWGIWSAAAPGSFFAFVFLALGARGVWEAGPLLDAASALGAGCLGAVLGGRFARS